MLIKRATLNKKISEFKQKKAKKNRITVHVDNMNKQCYNLPQRKP